MQIFQSIIVTAQLNLNSSWEWQSSQLLLLIFFATDGDPSLRLLHFPFATAVTSFSVKVPCSPEAASIKKSSGLWYEGHSRSMDWRKGKKGRWLCHSRWSAPRPERTACQTSQISCNKIILSITFLIKILPSIVFLWHIFYELLQSCLISCFDQITHQSKIPTVKSILFADNH